MSELLSSSISPIHFLCEVTFPAKDLLHACDGEFYVDECNMDALLAYNSCSKASMLIKETAIGSSPTEALLTRHWLLWESNRIGLNWLGSSKAQFVNFCTFKIKATYDMGWWVTGSNGMSITKCIEFKNDNPSLNQKHSNSIVFCYHNCMMPVYGSVDDSLN